MVAVILAAGKSERFGSNKLLFEIDGVSILQRILNAFDILAIDEIRVVTGLSDEIYRKKFTNSKITWILNKNSESGMSSSVFCGLQNISGDQPVFISPADLPFLNRKLINDMMSHFQAGTILIPRFRGKKGHPVLLDYQFVQECLHEKSDKILYDTISKNQKAIRFFETEEKGCTIDIDTMEDIDRLKAM